MRSLFLVLCAGCLLVTPVASQRPSVVAGLGAGIDLSDSPYETLFGFVGTSAARILVPIVLAEHFRLQPSLSYIKASREQSAGGQTDKASFRRWGLGLAAHYLFPIKKSVLVYLGGAVEFGQGREESGRTGPSGTFSSKTTRSDRTLSLLGGGEYFFTSRFSVGGEVRFDFVSFGDPSRTFEPPSPGPVPVVSEDLSINQTNAQVTVRWYFGDAIGEEP